MRIEDYRKSYRALQADQVAGMLTAIEGLGVAYDAMDSKSPWGIELSEQIIELNHKLRIVQSDLYAFGA